MEHPNLVQAARKWGNDVQFVGIVYQDKNEAVEAWLARNGGKAFPTLIDVNAKAAIAYGVYGVPETYFIGPDGVIRDKHVGPISWPELAEQVRRLKEDAS
jgi:cytochrome c biogenesis protein CcmG, thiol:disulfide interchange protein DsbE